MTNELERLLAEVHDEISVFEFDGKNVPCIIIKTNEYRQMISDIAGVALSIDTDLNILHDGLGNVFTRIVFTFSKGGIIKEYLVDAKRNLDFFETLAKTSMLALCTNPRDMENNIFMIQLPRQDKIQDVLEIIHKALIPKEKDA